MEPFAEPICGNGHGIRKKIYSGSLHVWLRRVSIMMQCEAAVASKNNKVAIIITISIT